MKTICFPQTWHQPKFNLGASVQQSKDLRPYGYKLCHYQSEIYSLSYQGDKTGWQYDIEIHTECSDGLADVEIVLEENLQLRTSTPALCTAPSTAS